MNRESDTGENLMRSFQGLACALTLVACALAAPVVTFAAGSAAKGAVVYAKQCAFCHGKDGAGDGEDAGKFYWAPANFKDAEFKLRSTKTGTLPTDADLVRTIKRGLPGTAMVSHEHLTDAQIADVVAHIKSLSPRWKEGPGQSVTVARPADFAAFTARGPEAYAEAGCGMCHGGGGRGSGPSTLNLTQNGRPTKPADLSRRPFKGGDTPEDIYRVLATGMDGTPMPSFETLEPAVLWAIVAQVQTLGKKGARSAPSADETAARALVKAKQPGRK